MNKPLQVIGQIIGVLFGENLETPTADAQGQNFEGRRYV